MSSIRQGHGLQRLVVVALLAIALGALAGIAPARQVEAQANGTLTIQKQLVDAMGMPVAGALDGYVFVLSGPTGMITMPPTNAMGQSTIGLPPAAYSVTEQPRSGVTFLGLFVGQQQQGAISITSNQTFAVTARNQVAGTAVISIQKQIVDANNAVIPNLDLSGFVFGIVGPGAFTATLTTPANGAVSIGNLAPGAYSVNEQPRSGFTFVAAAVDGVPIPNNQAFQVTAGQSRGLFVQNRQGSPTGTVRVTKEIVDAGGNVTTGDRAGYQISVQCATGPFNQTATTDANGIVSIGNVPAGACTISEAGRPGFQLVSIVPAGGSDVGNNGTITITASQTLEVRVRNRATGGGGGATESIALFQGCNNQPLTWPAGTPIATVAAAISPPGALVSIFRYDNATGRFFAYAPNVPDFANDYPVVVSRLEAVFICMNTAGTLTRPAI